MIKVLAILVGILLVVAGTVVVTYDSVTLSARQQQILSVGPLQASTASAQRTIPLPTVVGGAVVAAGIAVVFLGAFVNWRTKRIAPTPPADQTAPWSWPPPGGRLAPGVGYRQGGLRECECYCYRH